MNEISEIAEILSVHNFMKSDGIAPLRLHTGKLGAGSGSIRMCEPSWKKKHPESSLILFMSRDAGEKIMGAASPGTEDTG